jgi:hypothetical protein
MYFVIPFLPAGRFVVQRSDFTTKGPDRKVIAQWAIKANWPDCREGGFHKVAQRAFSTASNKLLTVDYEKHLFPYS